MFLRSLCLISLFSVSTAYGSFVIRGGGKICLHREFKAFDRFQIEQKDPFLFSDLDLTKASPQSVVENIVFKLISENDPSLGGYLANRYKEIWAFIQQADEDQLGMVIDSSSYLHSQSCPVVEVIEQRFDAEVGESQFFVQTYFWKRLSPLDKTVLILHEVFYREWFFCSKGNEADASFSWELVYHMMIGSKVREKMYQGGLACRIP